MNATLEQAVKNAIKSELERIAEESMKQQVVEFQRKLAIKSSEIISKVVEAVMIRTQEDPIYQRTVIQLELANIRIVGDGK